MERLVSEGVQMTRDDSFRLFVLEQLQGLRGVECRAMFGGYGMYHDGVFFGILYRERLYFKTDEATRPAFRAAGMKPFRPNANQTLTSYYEVPVDILEDRQRCVEWAREAMRIGSRRDDGVRGSRRRRRWVRNIESSSR